LVPVQGQQGAEVLPVRYRAHDELALVGPGVPARGGRLRLRHLLEDPQDLASDRGLPARRLRDRGAADRTQDHARGAVEDDLLVAAILALDPEELARGFRDRLCSSSRSNFLAWIYCR